MALFQNTTTESNPAAQNRSGTFYNKFLVCSFIGALGDYMTLSALGWYIVDSVGSAEVLGWVFFARTVPRFFMSFVGGYFADRMDRKKLIIGVYSGLMITTGLQILVIWNLSGLHWIYIVAVVFLRNVFDSAEPSIRNALLPDIVKKENIAKAVGFYASSLNLAAIFAPVLAGYLLSVMTITPLLIADFCLQIPSFLILFLLPAIPLHQDAVGKGMAKKGYIFAISYIRQSPVLRNSLILSVTLMFFLFPFGAMLPLLVKNTLQSDARSFGMISATEAFGAVLGGLLLKYITQDQLLRFWPWMGMLSCFFLLLLGFAGTSLAVLLIIFVLGLMSQLFRSTGRSIFQLNTPTEIRGKVMSVLISDSGIVSLGILFFTLIAGKLSVGFVYSLMGCFGMICCFASYMFLLKVKNKNQSK
ncbi:MFS transporter [Pedobacter sp. MR22-3]|uniref:MFS transporter n=1 Tax=Pedobacter sp. MR22-3 TaxID=2994552 RepID=UPI002245CA65|nr:MFS transporter [Pedobacter sp. MR22-3]MCX2582753.1 MFS transporter [Pedobacter sp. MR22-3]